MSVSHYFVFVRNERVCLNSKCSLPFVFVVCDRRLTGISLNRLFFIFHFWHAALLLLYDNNKIVHSFIRAVCARSGAHIRVCANIVSTLFDYHFNIDTFFLFISLLCSVEYRWIWCELFCPNLCQKRSTCVRAIKIFHGHKRMIFAVLFYFIPLVCVCVFFTSNSLFMVYFWKRKTKVSIAKISGSQDCVSFVADE